MSHTDRQGWKTAMLWDCFHSRLMNCSANMQPSIFSTDIFTTVIILCITVYLFQLYMIWECFGGTCYLSFHKMFWPHHLGTTISHWPAHSCVLSSLPYICIHLHVWIILYLHCHTSLCYTLKLCLGNKVQSLNDADCLSYYHRTIMQMCVAHYFVRLVTWSIELLHKVCYSCEDSILKRKTFLHSEWCNS